MRFLCCSDLHNGVAIAARLAARAREEGVDAIIVAGDLGHFLKHDHAMWNALASSGRPVLAVPGNHDGIVTWNDAVERSGVSDVDGRLVRLGEVAVAGWGWRWEAELWRPGVRPDPRLQRLRDMLRDVDPRKLVLVSHLPPWGVKIARADDGDDLGDDHLRDWIEEAHPWAVVCGHVHFPTARTSRIGETLVVNGGREGYVLTVG